MEPATTGPKGDEMQIPGSIPMDATTGSSPTDSTNSTNSQDNSTITANDFLTLLVTELKNQDPTANTDPNAYVDQLVQVNSLQQLIQINQNTIGTTTPTTAPTSGS
jgi:flagellar basal-body rod modification protein FlgD